MRAQPLIGRRIAKVNQTRVHDFGAGRSFMAIDSIELDDGSRIIIDARCYTDGDGFAQDAAEATHIRPVRRTR